MIMVQVDIEFLPTEKGGRRSPILAEYRPNFVFGYFGSLDDLQIENEFRFDDSNWTSLNKSMDGMIYPKNESISPGEKTISTVIFRNTDYINDFLRKGETFLVREGGRVVATGKIIDILEQSSEQSKREIGQKSETA